MSKKQENLSLEQIKETMKSLETQLQEHMRQSQHHQAMAIKAQGAMEVLNQLIPKEEKKNDSPAND